jgi:hypothetical protein
VASSATYNAPLGRYEKLSIWALAATVLVAAIGSAFAAGFVIGRILL